MKKKMIAVDLDGVLARYEGWKGIEHIGEPIEGAREFLESLSTLGRVMIYTTRCNSGENYPESTVKLASYIWDWLTIHEMRSSVFQVYIGQGKPRASAYVDDRAVACRPQDHDHPVTRKTIFADAVINVRKLVEGS